MGLRSTKLSDILKSLFKYTLLVVIVYFGVVKTFVYISELYFQQEAYGGLKTIYYSQRDFHDVYRRYSGNFSDIGWHFNGPIRYTYFVSPYEYRGRPPSELGLKLPIDFSAYNVPVPGPTENGYIAVAIGNLDDDNGLDVWWIDQSMTVTNGIDDVEYF